MSDPTAEANFLNKRATRAAGIIRFNLLRRNGKWCEKKRRNSKKGKNETRKNYKFSPFISYSIFVIKLNEKYQIAVTPF